MFLHNFKISIISIFFMLITLNFSGISMNAQKQEQTQQIHEICQCKVLQQKDGSSCGYHALYNGLTIAKSLKNSSFKDFLESNIDRDHLFGSCNSQWVKLIIVKRIELLAKFYISDFLFKNLRNIEVLTAKPEFDCYKLNLSSEWVALKTENNLIDSLEIKAFCNMITNVSNILVKDLLIWKAQKVNLKITPLKFMLAFKQEYIRRNMPIDKFYLNFLKVFNLTNCLNISIYSDSKIEIKDKNIGGNKFYYINWANFLSKDFVKLSNEDRDAAKFNQGYWLSSQEIEYLIKKEKKIDSTIADIDIFCLDRDMAQIFNSVNGETALIHARNNFQDKNYTGTAIFLIYDSNHWITCVVTKNSGELPTFIFADSLGADYSVYKNTKGLN